MLFSPSLMLRKTNMVHVMVISELVGAKSRTIASPTHLIVEQLFPATLGLSWIE